MKNTTVKLTDVDTKIELNLKEIEFYHSLYQKNQNKTSFLILIFTFIGLYLVEIIKYLFTAECDYSFIIVSILFLVMLSIALYKTYCLLSPVSVLYVNQPKYFYHDILAEYKKKLKTNDEDILNEYLQLTRLGEIETVLENNIKTYRRKTDDFTKAFKFLIPTLVLYLGLTSFIIIQKKENPNNFTIENYQEIINYIEKMDKKKPAEKPRVDPKMVIQTKPVVVRESIMFSKQVTDSKAKKKK